MHLENNKVDDSTFRKLKESKYHHPILTDVMFDYNMMLEMVYSSMTIVEKSFDTVWDSNMLRFTMNYFKGEVDFAEKLVKDRGIRMVTGHDSIEREIEYLTLTCRKELIVFSSSKILCRIMNKSDFFNNQNVPLERNSTIKILTDNIDEFLIKQIDQIINSYPAKQIQLGYTNK